MEPIELQQAFFQHIKSVHATNISLVDEIADLLNISNDSVYRRMRGEKAISFEEIQRLCRHYHISLDRILNLESDSIVFSGRHVAREDFDFEQYLLEMHQRIKTISQAGEKTIYYEAKDLPLFYTFQFSDLATFKYFFWMKTFLSYPEYARMKYEDNELKDLLHKTGTEIARTYNQVPSIEIWSSEIINATLRQIEYYNQAGIFRKKETMDLLLTQLEQMTEHLKELAEDGEKFMVGEKPHGHKGNFQLYYNEVFLGHNSVVVNIAGNLTSFINHGVMNYMGTTDTRFCNYTFNSLENTMKKSQVLSVVNEKERNRYFDAIQQKIRHTRGEVLG